MKLGVTLDILNQKATPAFYADTLANRPAAGYVGRVFISTDTLDLYRDTGTTWVLLSPSSGGISGSGTANTIPLWNASSNITNSVITQNSGNIRIGSITTSSKLNVAGDINAIGNLFKNGSQVINVGTNYLAIGDGTGLLNSSDILVDSGTLSITLGSPFAPYNLIGYANNYANKFIVNGASATQILVGDGTTITAGSGITISGGQISASGSGGGVTGTGSAGQVSYWSGATSITGTNNFFWDSATNRLGINTNTPTSALDVHSSGSSVISQLNQLTLGNDCLLAFQDNSVGKWRIGNYYNSGANDFAIHDNTSFVNRFTINNTGQTFVGDVTSSSGLLIVNSSTADNQIVAIGANAPSIRVRTSGTAPTYQFGLGLATTTNNFIQGTTAGEFCIFNSSLSAAPILFGIYNSGTGLIEEGARLSASKNWLLGTTTDIGGGNKLQVLGNSYLNGITTIYNSVRGLLFDRPNAFTYNGIGFATNGLQKWFYGLRENLGSDNLIIYNEGLARDMVTFKDGTGVINLQGVPTSSAGLVSGDIYQTAGVLMIV